MNHASLPNPLPGKATRRTPAPCNTRYSILVVDDEPSIRDVMELWLSSAGYEVTKAAGGEEALELMKGRSTPFDLFIIDLVMPDITGQELVQMITRISPQARTLYMSGFSNVHSAKSGRPQAQIVKPSSRKQLLSIVAEAIGSKRVTHIDNSP